MLVFRTRTRSGLSSRMYKARLGVYSRVFSAACSYVKKTGKPCLFHDLMLWVLIRPGQHRLEYIWPWDVRRRFQVGGRMVPYRRAGVSGQLYHMRRARQFRQRFRI